MQISALGVAGAALGFADSIKKKIPVGVELYSVRQDCKKDFPGTLAAIAKMGYPGVEFAGYWNRSAREIKKMLDDNGLVACGSHTPSEDVWLDKSKQFNDIAAQLKPLGLSIGYHSHFHDFHPVEGEAPWDIFGENTSPDVILQLDTSNCREGGADPLVELEKFPGRTRSIHIKPNGGGPEAVIGEDKINWAAIFAFCESKGGTEWYVVEHETSKEPLAAISRSFAALKKFGKV